LPGFLPGIFVGVIGAPGSSPAFLLGDTIVVIGAPGSSPAFLLVAQALALHCDWCADLRLLSQVRDDSDSQALPSVATS